MFILHSRAKSEKKDDKAIEPVSPGDIKHEQDKLLYIPSKTILKDCEGRMNANFSQLSKHCSQEEFVSMVIPAECDDEILASEAGLAYGIAEDKEKAYEVYKYELLYIPSIKKFSFLLNLRKVSS